MSIVSNTVRTLSTYQRSRDMVDIGAYRAGSNPELDKALKLMPALREFLCQDFSESLTREAGMNALAGIFSDHGGVR